MHRRQKRESLLAQVLMVATLSEKRTIAKGGFRAECACLGKVGEGGGLGFEGGDGFDKASDGESVADAAGSGNKAEAAAFTGETDGDAHESGNARAINLGDVIQNDDDFFRAFVDEGIESRMKLLAGFADGEPSVDVENGDGARFAGVDFDGEAIRHLHIPGTLPRSRQPSRFMACEALYDGGGAEQEPLCKKRTKGKPAQEDKRAKLRKYFT